jgi:pyridoxal phosphate enzyme (YggS family)
MSISDNLINLYRQIPGNVKLVAVSKTKPVDIIMEAYNAGHRIFGENKVQELIEKQNKLPKDIEWHMIGHLQTNKVKYIAPFIRLIHSVDSIKLLNTINWEALKYNRVIDCLLQLRIAGDEMKYGLSNDDIKSILNSEEFKELKNIRIIGLMGMATFTNDQSVIKSEFAFLASCFNEIKRMYFYNSDYFKELSMGMSDDYLLAIEAGSTIIRIGSIIFGPRY